MLLNSTSGDGNFSKEEPLDLLRHPLHLLIIYCVAYGIVFLLGLVGNVFVVMAVVWYPGMRSITNYFILSLAIADLLVILFCLPVTLMSNILNEWWLGNLLCKTSTWINGTAVCTSVYTLVAVTSDRYCAICHTMKYNVWEKRYTSVIIVPIWVVSGALFTPWLVFFEEVEWPLGANSSLVAKVCIPQFPSPHVERLLFLIVNFIVAFLIPLIVITVCYSFIFLTIFRHKSMAVDRRAAEREHRIKMKVTNMMLIVIILFAASWLPLYSLFTFIYFSPQDPVPQDSTIMWVVHTLLRPVFQWLSLSNSCINPILYAYFSMRFRRAFREILVLPCRRRYQRVQQFARRTMKRYSRNNSFSSVYHNQAANSEVGQDQASLLGSRRHLVSYSRGRARAVVGRNHMHHTEIASPSRAKDGRRRGKLSNVCEGSEIVELPPPPTSYFSPAGSSFLDSPPILLHSNPNASPILNVAPILTMRDLDIYSPSIVSSDRQSLVSRRHANGTVPSCEIRFAQIRDTTTV